MKAPVPAPIPPEAKPDRIQVQSKFKVVLRMGDGRPRFEIRNVETLDQLFKVYGDSIEIRKNEDQKTSSAMTGLTAKGKVKFFGPGLEGTCDELTIMSATGELLMSGNVTVKTKYLRRTTELTSDKMVYTINAQGAVMPLRTVSSEMYEEDEEE